LAFRLPQIRPDDQTVNLPAVAMWRPPSWTKQIGLVGERDMATRNSGRNEDRSTTRNAGGAGSNASSAPRKAATSTPTTNTSQASAQSRTSANQGANQGANKGVSGAAAAPKEQEREVRTSREQGTVRPSSSTPRGNVGQQRTSYASPSFASGASSPFAMMRRMMDDMDRLFSDFGFTHPGLLASALSGGRTPLSAPPSTQGLQRAGQRDLQQSLQSLWAPQVEVFERGNNFVIRADLPGLSREDVGVEIDDDALIIRGERYSDVEDDQEGYYRSERSYGSFYRAIPLPEGIDVSACNATFKDGVLEVTLPKPAQQASRTRRIELR
jgi:HSP20 family protein